MRVLVQIEDVDIIELDVQVLVDRLEGAADADVVFELDGHGLVCEGFEEAISRGWYVSIWVLVELDGRLNGLRT